MNNEQTITRRIPISLGHGHGAGRTNPLQRPPRSDNAGAIVGRENSTVRSGYSVRYGMHRSLWRYTYKFTKVVMGALNWTDRVARELLCSRVR